MERGSKKSVELYVDRLMRSRSGFAYLIIGVDHADDFIQMTGDSNGVQLDFPLITTRQQTREALIKRTAQTEGLSVVENFGTDGARFLDLDVHGSSRKIAELCCRMLERLFDVDDDTALSFDFDGLAD